MEHYIAKTQFGLEEVLADELQGLGAKNIEPLNRAVAFEADLETLYKIHLHSALCIRVIRPFHTFSAENEEELYNEVMKINWKDYMSLQDTFKIDAVVFSEVFTHSLYASLKVKDAICDWFREQEDGKRPDVNIKHPNYVFSLFIKGTDVQIAIDASNASLHQRKYRFDGGLAPLNEVLAAGMIALSYWDKKIPFVDGMCGSGTITIEALMRVNNKPAGFERRNFGFMNWPNFDEKLWLRLKQEAEDNIKHDYPNIKGIEIDPKVFDLAKENMVRAGFKPIHHLVEGDFFDYRPREKEGVLFINPPYDERIKDEHLNDFYKRIGDHMKQHYKGWTAWIISSNVEARKHIGLRTAAKIKLFNGKLECRLMKFELF
ncbi:MAG: putative N6-adenine-specific DNA methylase [Chitinophagales bacterium]|jgi:putative N6-adenine-specific DNA methylase